MASIRSDSSPMEGTAEQSQTQLPIIEVGAQKSGPLMLTKAQLEEHLKKLNELKKQVEDKKNELTIGIKLAEQYKNEVQKYRTECTQLKIKNLKQKKANQDLIKRLHYYQVANQNNKRKFTEVVKRLMANSGARNLRTVANLNRIRAALAHPMTRPMAPQPYPIEPIQLVTIDENEI